MSLTFNKSFFIIFFIIFLFHYNLKSDQQGDKYLFSFQINSENLNKIMKPSPKKSGKLDSIFSNFSEKYFSSQQEEASFYEDFKSFKEDKLLEITVEQEFFSWDSLKIKDFDFDQSFSIEYMGQIWDLKNAKKNSSNRTYKNVFSISMPNIINPRDNFRYIVQRELNFKPTFGWAHNTWENNSWIRTRDFPRDIKYDKIELIFFNFRDFDYFQKIFRKSTMKFKKKSASILSPIHGYKVVMFDYLPNYYEIKDSYINFSFIIPKSFTNKFYLDEIIISSPKENFLTSTNDKTISKRELLLKEILLQSNDSSKGDTIWYTKDNDDVIIDLSFLSMYEKDLIKKRSLKINSSNKFEFDYELGYSYKDWREYFNSTNMENRLKEVKKIIKENFSNNFEFNDLCFRRDNYTISNKPPFNFTVDATIINCDNNIRKIDYKNFVLKKLFYIRDHQVKQFKDKQNDIELTSNRNKSYTMFYLDVFIILMCVVFLKFLNKIVESFNKVNSANKVLLIILPIAFFSLINLKFSFIFLIFLYAGYTKYFYFKEL